MSQYPRQQSISFLDLIWKFKFQLVFYILCISTVTFTALYALGGVPQELRVLDTTETRTQPTGIVPFQSAAPIATSSIPKPQAKQAYANNAKGEMPRRIIIDKIDLNTEIYNPASSDNATLNNSLVKGVVRYPGSGTLGYGNMFLMGHSSSLKVINNPAYKVFNSLKLLNVNDRIQVQSIGKEFTYRVISVELVKSEDAFIDLSSSKNMITLATCNVLGEKEERFLVKAVYVSSKSL